MPLNSTNPFVNFLQAFRKKHECWTTTKLIVEGSREWRSMDKCKRRKYTPTEAARKRMKEKIAACKMARTRRTTDDNLNLLKVIKAALKKMQKNTQPATAKGKKKTCSCNKKGKNG